MTAAPAPSTPSGPDEDGLVGAAPVGPGLVETWQDAWPEALALWSRFTRLRPPLLLTTTAAAVREGLTGSFAMIRLRDQAVVVDLQLVTALGLADRPLEVLGHEIGHHIAAPASLRVNARAIARMRVALPGVEEHAPMLANLYADLLINDRLQRGQGLAIHQLYQAIAAAGGGSSTPLWDMYLRTYEILWGLARGTLASPAPLAPAQVEGDAQLCARLVRSYADQWVDGAGRFAALCFAYLVAGVPDAAAGGSDQLAPARRWGDAVAAGAGDQVPAGMSDVDPEEAAGAIHPAVDPELNGLGADAPTHPADAPAHPADDPPADAAVAAPGGQPSAGQRRELIEYGEILRALGLDLTDHDVAVRWYREQALPHLVPFPTRSQPVAGEVLPEGYAPWEPGEPLEDVDWLQSVMGSPVVIPGVTTVQRVHGTADLDPPRPVPLDLDIYVDSSGSMPDPQVAVSHPALAATVLVLSALRAGARVQATLWSGARQFHTTEGFSDDPEAVLRVVLGHIGGGTAFPLHVLRDTYAVRQPTDRPVHIVVISDEGVDTMFQRDEHGTAGRVVQADALRLAGGGGTLALQLRSRPPQLLEAAELGWRVEEVGSDEALVAFARRFARLTYTAEGRRG